MKKLLALSICASLLVLAGCNKDKNEKVLAAPDAYESSTQVKNLDDFEFGGAYHYKSYLIDEGKLLEVHDPVPVNVDNQQMITFKYPDGDFTLDFSDNKQFNRTFIVNHDKKNVQMLLSIHDNHSLTSVQNFSRVNVLSKDKNYEPVLDSDLVDFKNKRYQVSAQAFNNDYEFVDFFYNDENYAILTINNDGFFEFDKSVNVGQFLRQSSPLAFRIDNILFINMGGYGVNYNTLNIHENGVLTYYNFGFRDNPHIMYTFTPIEE